MSLTYKLNELLTAMLDDLEGGDTDEARVLLRQGIDALDRAEADITELAAHQSAGAFYARDHQGDDILVSATGYPIYADAYSEPSPGVTLEDEAAAHLNDAAQAITSLRHGLRDTKKRSAALQKLLDQWARSRQAELDQMSAAIKSATTRYRQLDRQSQQVIEQLIDAGAAREDAA